MQSSFGVALSLNSLTDCVCIVSYKRGSEEWKLIVLIALRTVYV